MDVPERTGQLLSMAEADQVIPAESIRMASMLYTSRSLVTVLIE